MPPTTRRARLNAAASYVFALPELWGIIAEHSGVAGAWRLMRVCKAAREGAKVWLRTLPGLVVCGGLPLNGRLTSEAWRLDPGELRWERMPSLTRGRLCHACCSVRGAVVVIGGYVEGHDGRAEATASVEILGSDSVAEEEASFKVLPPLSGGPLAASTVAVPIDESASDQGQVLLIGGRAEVRRASSAVLAVDLATGVCTPQPSLLSQHGVLGGRTAARLPDGRIVCVGKNENNSLLGTAQVLEPPPPPPPPEHGSPAAASCQWRYLPGMSVGHAFGGGCVLSDGRFAVFGGCADNSFTPAASCEVLTLDTELYAHIERWDPLPPTHEARKGFACAAIGGCVIVAGGFGSRTAEVYEEALRRWRRLPCSLPFDTELCRMGSALM
jgi:hypothetical protein